MEGASTPSVLLTVDKPFWQGFDKHGGFVKEDGNPPSRYILAKSEYNSDFAAQAVELLQAVLASHAVLTDQEAFEKIQIVERHGNEPGRRLRKRNARSQRPFEPDERQKTLKSGG